MSGMLTYNGYNGTVEYSHPDKVLFGKLFGINDLVTYEGTSVDELYTAFQESVDDYIETCRQLGKEPQKVFRGSFNVRIDPELHKRAAYEAGVLGQSLNEFVESSIALRIQQTGNRATYSAMSDERSAVKRSGLRTAHAADHEAGLAYGSKGKKSAKGAGKRKKGPGGKR